MGSHVILKAVLLGLHFFESYLSLVRADNLPSQLPTYKRPTGLDQAIQAPWSIPYLAGKKEGCNADELHSTHRLPPDKIAAWLHVQLWLHDEVGESVSVVVADVHAETPKSSIFVGWQE